VRGFDSQLLEGVHGAHEEDNEAAAFDRFHRARQQVGRHGLEVLEPPKRRQAQRQQKAARVQREPQTQIVRVRTRALSITSNEPYMYFV